MSKLWICGPQEKDVLGFYETSSFHHTWRHTHYTLRANTVCECGPGRHCGVSEAAQQPAQQRVEILKSLEETSSLSDGLRNFM